MMTVKELRKKCRLTQKEAAELLSIPLRTYSNYENDPEKTGTIKYQYIVGKLEEVSRIDEAHGILTIDEIRKACEDVFNDFDIKYCYLFGSYAKGTATETSDIDLLVSSNVTGLRFFGMVEQLKESLHKNMDVLDLSQLYENKALLDEILSEGIKIYG